MGNESSTIKVKPSVEENRWLSHVLLESKVTKLFLWMSIAYGNNLIQAEDFCTLKSQLSAVIAALIAWRTFISNPGKFGPSDQKSLS